MAKQETPKKPTGTKKPVSGKAKPTAAGRKLLGASATLEIPEGTEIRYVNIMEDLMKRLTEITTELEGMGFHVDIRIEYNSKEEDQ